MFDGVEVTPTWENYFIDLALGTWGLSQIVAAKWKYTIVCNITACSKVYFLEIGPEMTYSYPSLYVVGIF